MRALRALAIRWLVLIGSGGAALSIAVPSHAQIVAVDDAYFTESATALDVDQNGGVLANDSGGNGGNYTALLVAPPANGALVLAGDGGFFYTPDAGFTGNDAFTYQVDDDETTSNVATVTITVSAASSNVPPVAVDDAYSAAQETQLDVSAGNGVLANDADTEAGPLTAILVDGPNNGSLTLNPDGSFRYTPENDFTGNDEFQYSARDGDGALSAAATVQIDVVATNDAPVAVADSYSTSEGQTLNVGAGNGVLDNDTDPDGDGLTAFLVSGPSSGTLTLQPNGGFNFAPAAGFAGTVTFTYEAGDGTLRSGAATVTIMVNAANEAPTAQADSYATAEDTALSIPAAGGVLQNDTDPDGATTLTAALVRTVTNGSLTLRPDGSFTYTPGPNFNGTTTFTYQARDGSASSATVTVTITVTAANDAPFISNAAPVTATEGVTYRYTLAASDPDGDALEITAPTLPSWLRFSAPATVTGLPAESDVGTHDVTMQVSDGIASAVLSRFQISVQAVDNAPTIATIPGQTASEGAAFDLDLATFVTDPDTPAAEIRYAATRGLPPGMTLSATGRLSGTPTLGASVGRHTIRFTVADQTSRVPAQFPLTVIAADRIDLGVTLSVAPTPVELDTPVTWTVTIGNRAADVSAPGVVLEASFAGTVPFHFDAPTTPGCTATPSGNQTQLSCTLAALAGGASTTIVLTGRGSFAGDVFGHAAIAATGSAIDEVPDNDTATASLSVAKHVSDAPAQRIAGIDARAVAAADFDGDGFDDLAVATASPQGVVLFANTVDPANAARRTFETTPLSLGGEALGTDLAVADLDRDGDLDLVLAAAAGAPDRAFLAANGSFTSTALGAPALDSRAVAAADVNGDAFVDLVFAAPGGSPLLINTGSGGAFTSGPRVGAGDAVDVLLVDVLGDSLPDLVLANADGDAAIYGNSHGAFTLARTLPTGPTSAVASGDFNADGRSDLVFGRATAAPPGVPSTLVWLNGAALFLSDELGAAATRGLLVRDFDLDGRTDVLASSSTGQRLFTNAGAANGTFVPHPQQLATPGARGAAAGRFSNDERADLAVAGDGVAVFVGDGRGNFGSGDSTPPTLTLRGESTLNIVIDSPFMDPGATALDALDGDVSSRIVVSGSVNTAVLGTYTLTYAVSDLSGNAATPVPRTVNVQAQPEASDGGGAGAIGAELVLVLALLLAAWLARAAPVARRARFGAWSQRIQFAFRANVRR